MGGGHMMRCLALANALATHGAQSVFLCAQISNGLSTRITQAGHRLILLPARDTSVVTGSGHDTQAPAHASWLGSDWDTDWRWDAHQCSVLLDGMRPDWIVVDHYALDYRWHTQMRACLRSPSCGVLVIDDLGDRDLACDVLLDPNFRPPGVDVFSDRVPPVCKRFGGPQMALLDLAFGQAHLCGSVRHDLRHLLIYLGETPARFFVPILDALLVHPEVSADLVASDAIAQDPELRTHPGVQGGQVTLWKPQPNLISFMQRADLAIGPIGSTTWERLCLGVPTIAVTMAANQERIARDLHEAGLIDLLGRVDQLDAACYTAALTRMVQGTRIRDMSDRAFAECDGNGALRLAAYLVSLARTS